jgi:hypothetical protein
MALVVVAGVCNPVGQLQQEFEVLVLGSRLNLERIRSCQLDPLFEVLDFEFVAVALQALFHAAHSTAIPENQSIGNHHKFNSQQQVCSLVALT